MFLASPGLGRAYLEMGKGKTGPQPFQKTDGMCSSECWGEGLSQIPPLAGNTHLSLSGGCLLFIRGGISLALWGKQMREKQNKIAFFFLSPKSGTRFIHMQSTFPKLERESFVSPGDQGCRTYLCVKWVRGAEVPPQPLCKVHAVHVVPYVTLKRDLGLPPTHIPHHLISPREL